MQNQHLILRTAVKVYKLPTEKSRASYSTAKCENEEQVLMYCDHEYLSSSAQLPSGLMKETSVKSSFFLW